MVRIEPLAGWQGGDYVLLASSNAAKNEWDALVARAPDAAKRMYERLSSEPLTPWGTRQFPLRGKKLKPFWEFEVTAGERAYYAVDLEKQTVVVAVGSHPTSSPAAAKTIESRRKSFDELVVDETAKKAAQQGAAGKKKRRSR